MPSRASSFPTWTRCSRCSLLSGSLRYRWMAAKNVLSLLQSERFVADMNSRSSNAALQWRLDRTHHGSLAAQARVYPRLRYSDLQPSVLGTVTVAKLRADETARRPT